MTSQDKLDSLRKILLDRQSRVEVIDDALYDGVVQLIAIIGEQQQMIDTLRHDHDVWVETCKRLFGEEYEQTGDDDEA